MSEKMDSKWYNSKGFVVLLLVLIFPLGLYALYKNRTFTKNAKIGLTAGLVFLLILASASDPKVEEKKTVAGYDKEYVEEKIDESNIPKTKKSIEKVPPQPLQTEKPKSIYDYKTGVSYDQMTNYLDKFFDLKRESDVYNYPRYMSQSENGLAVLEIIGNKNDISHASLLAALPIDNTEAIVENSAFMLRFVMNADTSWGGAGNWISSALKKVAAGSDKESIIRGNNKITLQKSYTGVTLTFKNKNNSG